MEGEQPSERSARVDALGVARGPLRATVFFLMEATASGGMVETPSMMVGVTSTSSQLIGTCERTRAA